MDNKEAIKFLKSIKEHYLSEYDIRKRAAIEIAISELENDWVPVAEKQPEVDGTYLVTTYHDYDGGHRITTPMVLDYADGWNCARIGKEINREYEMKNVLAWKKVKTYKGE